MLRENSLKLWPTRS